MDATYAVDAAIRLRAEQARTSAPEGFPELPDIPLRRYTDPGFHQLELDAVFGRSWLFVGHESEVPEPGCFRTLDLPQGSLVLVRGSDSVVRCFRNACRHRGAPVVREAQGSSRRLTCQFHSWSYGLDGTLVQVPGAHDFVGLDPTQRCLPEIRVESWHGLLFVNFDPGAEPLASTLGAVSRRFDPLVSQPTRHVLRTSYDIAANWKVVIEAFLEVYHVKTVHPTTAAAFSVSESTVFDLHDGGHLSMYMPYAEDVATNGAIRDLMFPPDLASAEAMPDIFATTNVLFALFPNLVSPLSPQGFPMVQAWPVAIDRTRFDVTWIGLDWGDGPRPDGWETKFLAWDVVLAEDMTNLAPIQRSLETAAHGGIPIGYQERSIWHFHASIDRAISSNGPPVPAELAVPDLLAGHVVD